MSRGRGHLKVEFGHSLLGSYVVVLSAMSDEHMPVGTEQGRLTKPVIAVCPLMDTAERGPRQKSSAEL